MSGGSSPRSSSWKRAHAAIMAPLSVHSTGGGISAGTGDVDDTRSLSSALAVTPPPRIMPLAPHFSAASSVLRTMTSTTDSWNAADIS